MKKAMKWNLKGMLFWCHGQAAKPEVQVWGFGCPRVGNIPFAERYEELVFKTWRISNLNDLVTK